MKKESWNQYGFWICPWSFLCHFHFEKHKSFSYLISLFFCYNLSFLSILCTFDMSCTILESYWNTQTLPIFSILPTSTLIIDKNFSLLYIWWELNAHTNLRDLQVSSWEMDPITTTNKIISRKNYHKIKYIYFWFSQPKYPLRRCREISFS